MVGARTRRWRGKFLQSVHSMKHVKKSVLLWYSPHEMFDLVTAVKDYPRFLPWCESAELLQQHDDGVTARWAWPTWACATPSPRAMPTCRVKAGRMQLVDGPFSLLDGTWLFVPLGRAGQRHARLQDRVRPALRLLQHGAGNGGQPGVRPRGQHLRRLVRAARRRRVWPPLRCDWSLLGMRLLGKALTFDDVLLVPAFSQVLPRDTLLGKARDPRFPATSA
jgi:ribosome-associated toxin RatA of RatAB toxin-antitoxin module